MVRGMMEERIRPLGFARGDSGGFARGDSGSFARGDSGSFARGDSCVAPP